MKKSGVAASTAAESGGEGMQMRRERGCSSPVRRATMEPRPRGPAPATHSGGGDARGR